MNLAETIPDAKLIEALLNSPPLNCSPDIHNNQDNNIYNLDVNTGQEYGLPNDVNRSNTNKMDQI